MKGAGAALRESEALGSGVDDTESSTVSLGGFPQGRWKSRASPLLRATPERLRALQRPSPHILPVDHHPFLPSFLLLAHYRHMHTMEGFWSLLRSWLRPHRGISHEKLPLYLGFFAFVHNVRKRGNALLGARRELLGREAPGIQEERRSQQLDNASILGNIAGSGVGGAMLMVIIGFITKAMATQGQ
jgi:hypothetical protein